MPKRREQIPAELAAEVIYKFDRTCCICVTQGKAIQIHHINEDPSDNRIENLAVLCLECHNKTHIKGGFGRGITKEIIKKYRDEWVNEVSIRRSSAESASSIEKLTPSVPPSFNTMAHFSEEKISFIVKYIELLPEYKNEIYNNSKIGWDTGNNQKMILASANYIDSLSGVIINLASFYPSGCFSQDDPREFLFEIVSSRFAWHRAHLESYGPGTGGTIVDLTVYACVMSDVEHMILDMVTSLTADSATFDRDAWKARWVDQAG